MNPLIKELASKALKQPDTDNDGLTVFDNDELEKFAKLIVEECGDVAYNTYWGNPETVRGIHIKEKIKEHFGVEE